MYRVLHWRVLLPVWIHLRDPIRLPDCLLLPTVLRSADSVYVRRVPSRNSESTVVHCDCVGDVDEHNVHDRVADVLQV